MMFPVVVIVILVDTELVPSLMVIEYCPAAAGEVARIDTTFTTPLASVVRMLGVTVLSMVPVLIVHEAATGVIQAAGVPGVAVIVRADVALKPLT